MSAVEPRVSVMVAWEDGYARQVYRRHLAVGDRTLCGIPIAASCADPPGFKTEDAVDCQRRGCRAALAARAVDASVEAVAA